jgi:UDP:flavonoid glycosyltransferase YjiC (YdhE family)
VDAVATVGSDIDPAQLGPRLERIRVERYVDQALVLPRCDAVVCHGGSGTLVGALAHGLPLVVIPLGADQPFNAARCAELGVARVLDPVSATPAEVHEAVAAVLAEPGYRRAAEPLRDELDTPPSPASAMPLLERLEVVTCTR